MKNIILLLKRIIRYIRINLSYQGREINRISNINRHKESITNLYGRPFKFIDSASFVGQFNEIIKNEIYNFTTEIESPYIVDCGANVGNSILYFKKKYPQSEIVAFEPDKDVFLILQENIKTFSFEKVTLINKGVWNSYGRVNFLSSGDDSGKITTQPIQTDNLNEIQVTSLRSYLNKRVHLLKIDIEGAEYVVLKDISDILFNVERIFIEYHSFANENQNLHLILDILNNAGFRYYLDRTTIFSNNPFIKINVSNSLDNLINIFGYRENGK